MKDRFLLLHHRSPFTELPLHRAIITVVSLCHHHLITVTRLSRFHRHLLCPPSVPHYCSYHDAYSPFPYHSGYYSSAPPQSMPPRPFFDRTMDSYGSGPSAPVDNGTQRHKGGKRMGFGTGLAVGAVAGALACVGRRIEIRGGENCRESGE